MVALSMAMASEMPVDRAVALGPIRAETRAKPWTRVERCVTVVTLIGSIPPNGILPTAPSRWHQSRCVLQRWLPEVRSLPWHLPDGTSHNVSSSSGFLRHARSHSRSSSHMPCQFLYVFHQSDTILFNTPYSISLPIMFLFDYLTDYPRLLHNRALMK